MNCKGMGSVRYRSWKLFSPPLNNSLLTGYVLQALNPPSKGFNKSPAFPILPKTDTPGCKVGPSPLCPLQLFPVLPSHPQPRRNWEQWPGKVPAAKPGGWRWGEPLLWLLSRFCKRTGRKMRSWCDEGTHSSAPLIPPILLPVPGGDGLVYTSRITLCCSASPIN